MHHLFGRPAPRPHGQLGFQRAKEDTFHMKSVGLIFTQNLQIHKPFSGKILQCHGFSYAVIRTEIWSTTQVRSTMLFLARGVSLSPEQTQPKEWIIISFKFVRRVLLSDSSKRYNYLSLEPMTLRNFALNSRPFLFFRLSAQLRLGARDICLHVDGGDPGGHEPGQGTPWPQGKMMGRV